MQFRPELIDHSDTDSVGSGYLNRKFVGRKTHFHMRYKPF